MTLDSSNSELMARFNRTLLHCAAYYNSTSCLTVLSRISPHHLDAVDIFNITPLMIAVMNDNIDAAKVLVRAGADARMKDNDGRTVFYFARSNNNKKMLEIFEDVGNIETTSTGKWNILILLKL